MADSQDPHCYLSVSVKSESSSSDTLRLDVCSYRPGPLTFVLLPNLSFSSLPSSRRWSVAKFGAVGPIVEFYRIFVCSEYYFKHPELIVALDSDSHKLCSISAVEARMSTINVIVTLLSAAASALGLLIFTPLLSKGRKRVLLFGILGCAFTNLPFIILPIGYPFSDQPQALNPEKILILFMVITILAGLLSPEELPLLACRVLLNDRSSAQRRTRNMSVSGNEESFLARITMK